LANAVAFLLSALRVGRGLPGDADRSDRPGTSYRAEFSAGFDTLRRDSVLVAMVAMIAVTNFLDQAYAMVLLPVWVKEAGHDVSWVGILLAVFSAGAIAGAAVAAAMRSEE